MLFHQAFAQSIKDQGIETIFGVIGDGNLFMMDSYQRHAGGRYVSLCSEAGAMYAANGYASASSRLGVACVTHGPALTNAVTGLVESVKARRPILLIAADTAVLDRDNFQSVAQRDIVVATGAGFEQVRTPEIAGEDLATACRRAVLERRPIVLNVPVDFQWQEVEYEPSPVRWIDEQALGADEDALDRAVGVIASAHRPLLLAGRGAIAPATKAALLHLADRLGAPLASTLQAKEIFRDQPASLGVHGTLSDSNALDLINRSDCLIAFGASLNPWTTARGSLLQGKSLVQVDSDRAAIDRWALSTVGVVGDAALVANQFVDRLTELGTPPSKFAAEAVSYRPPAASVEVPSDGDSPGLVAVLEMLDQRLPAERTLVLDGGRFVYMAFTALRVPDPLAYVHTLHFGSIGLGMGNAVGAALARPGRMVLHVCGDGGFMLGGLNEFSSAVRHGLDIVTVVLNDGAYGAEHLQFVAKDIDPSLSCFEWPSFAEMAEVMGGTGYTVNSVKDLERTLAELSERTGPALIDVRLDPYQVPHPGK